MRHSYFIILLLPLLLLTLSGCDSASDSKTEKEAMPFDLINLAENGDLNTVQALLTAGSPPDIKDSCQWTPLMKAALNGHYDIVQLLLLNGASVDEVDKGGYTALQLAASNNHARIVELLIQFNAAINHQERSMGWTALIWASKLNHIDTVKVLLNYGANLQITDFKGYSALSWARKIESQALIDLLEAVE